jgi:hypothetical protein
VSGRTSGEGARREALEVDPLHEAAPAAAQVVLGLGIRPARARHGHSVEAGDPNLRRVLGADLAEQFGLKGRQPGEPRAHRSAQVMLGKAIGREGARALARSSQGVRVAGDVVNLGRRVARPLGINGDDNFLLGIVLQSQYFMGIITLDLGFVQRNYNIISHIFISEFIVLSLGIAHHRDRGHQWLLRLPVLVASLFWSRMRL